MTLEEATNILNTHRHRGHAEWYVSPDSAGNCIVLGKYQYEVFEPFEAIAIAEKYVFGLRASPPMLRLID
jgi:hypothetical protein